MFGKGGQNRSAEGGKRQWQRKVTKQKVSIKKRIAQWVGLSILCLFTLAVWGAALEDPEVRQARQLERAEQAKKLALAKAEQDKVEAAEQRLELCDRAAVNAYVMTQDQVRARLRSPSSAKFPWITDIVAKHTGNCKYQIIAYVDAQNGFGAMLRTYYQAKMQYYPERKAWRTLSVKIEQ